MLSSPLLSLSPEKLESEVVEKVSCYPRPPTPPWLSDEEETCSTLWSVLPWAGDGVPGSSSLWILSPASICAQVQLLFWGALKVLDWAEGPHTTDQLSGSISLNCSEKGSSSLHSPSSPMHFPRKSKSYEIIIVTQLHCVLTMTHVLPQSLVII